MNAYIVIVALCSATLAIYYFSPRETTLKHECHLKDGPCELRDGDFQGTFSIDTWPVRGSAPVRYELLVHKKSTFKPQTVTVSLVGQSMHMDWDEFTLKQKTNHDDFAMLRDFPYCQEKRMVWSLLLTLTEGNSNKRANFAIEVMR